MDQMSILAELHSEPIGKVVTHSRVLFVSDLSNGDGLVAIAAFLHYVNQDCCLQFVKRMLSQFYISAQSNRTFRQMDGWKEGRSYDRKFSVSREPDA